MLVLGALVAFAQPMGDDFCFGFVSPATLWSRVAGSYARHAGRWAAVAILTMVSGSVDLLRAYAAPLVAVITLRVMVTYVLVRAVLQPGTPKRLCALVAGSFSLLYWSAMPATGDAILWLTEALDLELASIVLLLAVAVLFGSPLTWTRGLSAALLVILLTGQHELAGMAVCVVLLAACGLAHRVRSPNLRIWLALLAVATAGLLVEVMAPGNYVRAAKSGIRWNVWWAFAVTAGNLTAWIPRWLFDAPLLLSALLVAMEPRIRLREKWSRPDVRVCALAVWIALLASGFFVPGLALHGLLPGRLLNWLYFLFLTGLFANLLLWKARWPEMMLPAAARRPACSMILVATFAAMFFSGNPWLGAADLVFRIPAWHTARSAMLKSLQFGTTGRDVALPALPPTPHMYFDYDASSDFSEYPNRCMAQYFGVKTIVGPNPPKWPRGAALSGRTYGLLSRPQAPNEIRHY